MILQWPSTTSHVQFSASPVGLCWPKGALREERAGDLWDGLDELEDELQELDEEQQDEQQEEQQEADEGLGEETELGVMFEGVSGGVLGGVLTLEAAELVGAGAGVLLRISHGEYGCLTFGTNLAVQT